MVASPSPTARTMPRASTLAMASSDEAKRASGVRSPTILPSSSATTTRRWVAWGPLRVISPGSTRNPEASTGDERSAAVKSVRVIDRRIMGARNSVLALLKPGNLPFAILPAHAQARRPRRPGFGPQRRVEVQPIGPTPRVRGKLEALELPTEFLPHGLGDLLLVL